MNTSSKKTYVLKLTDQFLGSHSITDSHISTITDTIIAILTLMRYARHRTN